MAYNVINPNMSLAAWQQIQANATTNHVTAATISKAGHGKGFVKNDPTEGDQRAACWNKGTTISGFNPDRWRMDPYGNPIFKPAAGLEYHKFGWSTDHIIPFEMGGPSKWWNCQPCQRKLDHDKDRNFMNKTQMQQFAVTLNLPATYARTGHLT